MANAFEAFDPDGIAGEQILIFIDLLGQDLDELLNPAEEIERRFKGEAADAKI